MENHIIVCGLGRMGRQATEQLGHKSLSVVVIEQSQERAAWAEGKGLPVIVGNASDDRTLMEAGVERARGLITCVSNDADNVVITLSAKAINPKVIVVARCASEEIHRKLLRVGADRVVSPYEIGGRRMAYALLYPTVVEFMDTAMRAEQIDLTVEELRVAPHSALCGKTIANSEIHQKTGALIVGVKLSDGRMLSNPPGHHILNDDQILIVLGNPEQLGKLDSVLRGQVQHLAPTFE